MHPSGREGVFVAGRSAATRRVGRRRGEGCEARRDGRGVGSGRYEWRRNSEHGNILRVRFSFSSEDGRRVAHRMYANKSATVRNELMRSPTKVYCAVSTTLRRSAMMRQDDARIELVVTAVCAGSPVS